MKITRNIQSLIETDLKRKMVFVGGPRQVGETTLAKSLIRDQRQYLNWDFLEDRAIIKKHTLDPQLKLIILDELHKYARYGKCQGTLVAGIFSGRPARAGRITFIDPCPEIYIDSD